MTVSICRAKEARMLQLPARLALTVNLSELDGEVGRKSVDKEGQGLAEQNMYQVQNSIYHDMI